MVINGETLLLLEPIKNMAHTKIQENGVSYGLSEVGYDIRIKQEVRWTPPDPMKFIKYVQYPPVSPEDYRRAFFGYTTVYNADGSFKESIGRTVLASSIEKFDVPKNLWGELRNKSTHARCFLDASIGTDIEPGWRGFLTIEIIFHGNEPLTIPAGSGMAKVVFHQTLNVAGYEGKYQDQEDRPVESIFKNDKSSDS
ncbi:dCTP deaminase protein [Rhizobium phage RHph_X2_28B]|uniref:dCTP deaminase n=1 Tax=Rhizobium phage RHph_X2_28B TaxID=2836086 RepID=UPI00232921AD|nr:dCTP deaminase [Rhizobium phage RHph_X2_28B]QWY83494.1 dCTP deaminase protein [Rhizobium phage RHph_X2_28B]QWY83730.1 dCTP deaminase protein [Rhizobium phage RHph_X3_15]